MNTSVRHPLEAVSERNYAIVFLIIPGLKNVSVGCAMLIGRLLQEAMDHALANKGLLVTESPASRTIVDAMQRETAARLNGAGNSDLPTAQPDDPRVQSPRGLNAGRRFIEDVAERLYGEPLLSFVRHEDRIYFGFCVSDIKAGQRVIETEIKRLGFSELAEVGHYHAGEKTGRPFHPRKSVLTLTPHCVEVLQGAGLLPA